MKIKKIYQSVEIDGNLSKLCNIRDSIAYADKDRVDNVSSSFLYNFSETSYSELLKEDRIYVIQTASNRFIEVNETNVNKFSY